MLNRPVAARRRGMPEIATSGKHFFLIFERTGAQWRTILMNPDVYRSASRRFVLASLLAPAAVCSAPLVQKTPPTPPADASSPALIWDIDLKLETSSPRNFRTTDDPLKENKGELPSDAGLADLRASGSGEFTAEGLKLLLARIRAPVTV